VAPEELAEVEAEANARLVANSAVTTTITSKEDAEEMGAIAFFGDKYGDVVRVVRVGEFSTEFCGGTHTHTAGQVGPLTIVSESSIGSNLRRVEALTGMAAYDHLVSLRGALGRTGQLLRTPPESVPERVEQLLEKVGGLEEQLEAIAHQRMGHLAEELSAKPVMQGDVSVVVADAGHVAGNELRQIALGIRDRLQSPSVVILGSAEGGKGALVAAVSKDLVEKGISAGELLSNPSAELGGGGSRDPELAQAGGPQGNRLAAALDSAREESGRALGGL
jgi:alanyl-tRNA synthetase